MVRSGRPRKTAVDSDILQAFAELIEERGYSHVTVEDVVTRANTNKPAFYRRFRGLSDVVPRLLALRHGTDVDIDTGTLVGDLCEVQRRQRGLFTDPVVVRGLVGWLADVDAEPDRAVPFLHGYLAPRRAYTRVILDRAVRRGEIEKTVDPDWIADLLTGPLIMRAILPGLPAVSGTRVSQTIHAVLDALGYDGDRSAVVDCEESIGG